MLLEVLPREPLGGAAPPRLDAPELEEIDEEMAEDWVGEEDEEDDGPVESTPLLPMFSSSDLGMRDPINPQLERMVNESLLQMPCPCTILPMLSVP